MKSQLIRLGVSYSNEVLEWKTELEAAAAAKETLLPDVILVGA